MLKLFTVRFPRRDFLNKKVLLFSVRKSRAEVMHRPFFEKCAAPNGKHHYNVYEIRNVLKGVTE